MAVQGCHKAMKFVLIAFNVLVLLVGVAAIVLGVLAITSDYGAEEMKEITGSDLYMAGCIVVIVGGAIIVIISFLGCAGSYWENRVMLGIYFALMLLFLILFVVGAAVGFLFMDELEEELEEELSKTLIEKYGTDGNDEVTDVWNKIQKELKCCGVSGGRSSTTSWFLWQSSEWYSMDRTTNQNLVPKSCCNINGDAGNTTLCQKRNMSVKKPPQFSEKSISESNTHLYEKGCIDSLKEKIEDNIVVVAVIAVIVLIVMLLCVIFSVCVCTEIRKKD